MKTSQPNLKTRGYNVFTSTNLIQHNLKLVSKKFKYELTLEI